MRAATMLGQCSGLHLVFLATHSQMIHEINYLGIESMASPGRPFGSRNVKSEKPFGEALRIEIAAAGADQRVLRKIARHLLDLAQRPEQSALSAIREIADRLDGKP